MESRNFVSMQKFKFLMFLVVHHIWLRRIFKDQTSHTKGSAWTAWTYFRPFLNCLCSRSGWHCRGAENEQNMFKKRPGTKCPCVEIDDLVDLAPLIPQDDDVSGAKSDGCSILAHAGRLMATCSRHCCALLDEIFRAGRTPGAQLLSSSPLSELTHSALVLELTDCTATCEA